jgi:hypothetical protein
MTEDGGIQRAAGSVQILHASAELLRVRLAKAAHWRQYRRRERDWVAINPPTEVAPTLLSAVGDWLCTPHLSGIVQAPTLRLDGTVLQTPGYDVRSGLYFDSCGLEFPCIMDSPSRADAQKALEMLLATISDFPYVDSASRSVMLAAILTPLCRHAMRSAPIIGFSAPAPGSGKTLQSHLPAYIATGLPARLFSLPQTLEEAKKRYLAILLEGAPIAVIDNVERPIRDDALCTILTERTCDKFRCAPVTATNGFH